MKAHNIEVFARDGEIVIRQETSSPLEEAMGDGFDLVFLTADQASSVCTWIMRAARDAALQSERIGGVAL